MNENLPSRTKDDYRIIVVQIFCDFNYLKCKQTLLMALVYRLSLLSINCCYRITHRMKRSNGNGGNKNGKLLPWFGI